jgi:hypothetical protein
MRRLSRLFIAGVLAVCVPRTARAQGRPVFEFRQELAGVLMPSNNYKVSGACATGDGLAPASLYAPGENARGVGIGAGVGVRVGYQYVVSPPTGTRPTWWGFRLGLGFDLALLYTRVPAGMPDLSGTLCAHDQHDTVDIRYQGSALVLAQIPLFLGPQFGVGAGGARTEWNGVVLGAAWAPAVTYVQPGLEGGILDMRLLGTELTLDFASLHPGTVHEASKRIAAFLLFPAAARGPMILTVSFGVVWS